MSPDRGRLFEDVSVLPQGGYALLDYFWYGICAVSPWIYVTFLATLSGLVVFFATYFAAVTIALRVEDEAKSVSVLILPKDIEVANDSEQIEPVLQPIIGVCFHYHLDNLRLERYRNGFASGLRAVQSRIFEVVNTAHLGDVTKIGIKKSILTDHHGRIHRHLVRWCLSGVMDLNFGAKFSGCVRHQNTVANIEIRTQLFDFSVLCNANLFFSRVGLPFGFFESIIGDDSSNNRGQQRKSVYNDAERRDLVLPSPICGFGGLILCCIGVPILIFGIHRGNLWLGIVAIPAIIAGGAVFVLWLIFHAENAPVATGVSAARYSHTENVCIVPIVVPELKLRDVQRQIFLADFVECPHDAAFQQRPKAVDCLSVDGADDVLTNGVTDHAVRVFPGKAAIGSHVVSCEQADLFGHRFPNEAFHCLAIECLNHAGDNFALATDRTNDTRFTGASSARAATPLIPVFVAVLAADIGFIDFNDAAELVGLLLQQSSTNAIAHVERGLVGAEAHVAHDLQAAHSLFAREHQVNNLEPVAERLVGVFEHRPDQNREAIAALRDALGALPVEGTIGDRVHVHIAAAWTVDAFGPAAIDEVLLAGILVREHGFKLLICKLFYRLDPGHFALHPPTEGPWHSLKV